MTRRRRRLLASLVSLGVFAGVVAFCSAGDEELGRGSLDGAIAPGTTTYCQALRAGHEASYAEVIGLNGEAVAAEGANGAAIEVIGVDHETSGYDVEFAVLVSSGGEEPPPLSGRVRPEIDAAERDLELAYLPTTIRLEPGDFASIIVVATLEEDSESELGRTLVNSVEYRVGDERAIWPVAVGYWVARVTDPDVFCSEQARLEMDEFKNDH